jgi:hypothetical protein
VRGSGVRDEREEGERRVEGATHNSIRAIIMAFGPMTPLLTCLAIFITYSLLGNIITPELVFPCLGTFLLLFPSY